MVSARCWILLAFVPFASAFTTAPHPSSTRNSWALSATTRDESNNHRRRLLAAAVGGVLAATVSTVPASAAVDKQPTQDLLSQLRAVPTFCLVNTDGIPYVAGFDQKDRVAKGYAFTSMEGAITVLADAQKKAKEEGNFDGVWDAATIVTLPADVAVRLALQKRERSYTRGGKEGKLDSIINIIPTNESIDAASLIDGKAFRDQGKVPLFYFDGLLNDDRQPLFLQKSALIEEWQTRHPKESAPVVRAVDLTYLFEALRFGYLDKIPNQGRVSFVPDPEQVAIADRLRKEGLTRYGFDKMII